MQVSMEIDENHKNSSCNDDVAQTFSINSTVELMHCDDHSPVVDYETIILCTNNPDFSSTEIEQAEVKIMTDKNVHCGKIP